MIIYKKIIYNENNINIIVENNIEYYNLLDIGKILNIKQPGVSVKNYKNEVMKFIIDTNGGKQKVNFITLNGLKKLLSKSRKHKVIDFAKFLNIDILDIHSPCFESTNIAKIMKVFKNENIKCQYSVDNYYFIDLYFIDYNLAIECDEVEHKYTKEQDIIREEYIIEKLNCHFIRFNPDIKDFDILDVISEIHYYMKTYDKLA
jgi:very-short-patch-repair endonuclease